MKLTESILDIPQKEYAPWLLGADDKFQPEIRNQILNLIQDWKEYTGKDFNITKIEAKGSLLSKRYNDTSDLDISIYTDLTPEERDNIIKTLPREQTIIIDGEKSEHPLDFYVLAKGETTPIEGLDNLYDLINNTWIKRSEEYDNELPLDYVDQVCGFFSDACQLSLSNYNSDKVLYKYYADTDPAKQEITPEERQEALDEKIEDLKRDLDAMRLALHMISAFRSEAYKGDDSTPFKITIEVSSDNPHVTLNEQLCKLLEKLGVRQQLREAVVECTEILNDALPKTEQVEEITEALSKEEFISELQDLQQDAAEFSQSAKEAGYMQQATAAEGKVVAYDDALELAKELSDGVVVHGLQLHESTEKAVAFTFARMNPITKGHIETVVKALSQQPGEKRIYLSHTQDKKNKKDPLKNKNPLAYEDKLRFARLAVAEHYPEVQVMDSGARTIIAVLCELYEEGFNEITFIVGSDRVDDFKALITKYNGLFSEENIGYEFRKINYICAGERIDDGDDIQAMSASKLRKLAIENNLQAFTDGSPFKNEWIAEEEFNLIRDAML